MHARRIVCAQRRADDLIVLPRSPSSPVPEKSGISWVYAYMKSRSFQKICCVLLP
jgi:hypothetical protein